MVATHWDLVQSTTQTCPCTKHVVNGGSPADRENTYTKEQTEISPSNKQQSWAVFTCHILFVLCWWLHSLGLNCVIMKMGNYLLLSTSKTLKEIKQDKWESIAIFKNPHINGTGYYYSTHTERCNLSIQVIFYQTSWLHKGVGTWVILSELSGAKVTWNKRYPQSDHNS